MKKSDIVIPVEEEESSSDGEGLVTLKGSSNFLSIATHLGRSLKFPQSRSLRPVHRPRSRRGRLNVPLQSHRVHEGVILTTVHITPPPINGMGIVESGLVNPGRRTLTR